MFNMFIILLVIVNSEKNLVSQLQMVLNTEFEEIQYFNLSDDVFEIKL